MVPGSAVGTHPNLVLVSTPPARVTFINFERALLKIYLPSFQNDPARNAAPAVNRTGATKTDFATAPSHMAVAAIPHHTDDHGASLAAGTWIYCKLCLSLGPARVCKKLEVGGLTTRAMSK